MAVRKYPGYAKATPSGGIIVLDDNDYAATIKSCKVTTDQEKNEDVWDWAYTLGPDQPEQKDETDVSGKIVHDFLRIPLEGHPHFEDWADMRMGMLKARALACGLGGKKGEVIPDPEDFAGKDITFHAKKRSYTKTDGSPGVSNDFSNFKAYKE